MEVILLQDVSGVGKKGDVVKVKDGYARNYLIPRKFALPATPGNLKMVREQMTLHEERSARRKKEAEDIKQRLKKVTLKIAMPAGEDGKLFGSVTTRDIEKLLRKKRFQIDHKRIELDEPIKHLGQYKVRIRLHPEVIGEVTLSVTKE